MMLVWITGPAAAETEFIVLGPVAVDAKVPAKLIGQIKAVLEKAGMAPGQRSIDAVCAIDAACLATAGGEARAKQVVAISVGRTSNASVALDLVLVDVAGKELIARRPIAIRDAKVATELAPALRKFIDEAPTERAKALFAEGNGHYSLGEFVQALLSYKRAYRIKPLPAFLFNIAQCHRKLEQHQDAITMYQSYLVGVPDAQNKPLVESLITESRDKLAQEQRLTDEREAARLAVERKLSEDRRKGQEAEALAAQRKVEQARIEADREREREKLFNRHPSRRFAVIAGGVGAGAVIAGGVFALRARSAQSSFDSAGCGDPTRLLDQPALAQCVDDRDQGKRAAQLGGAFLVGGGVVFAASALVFVIDPGNLERPDSARARVAITPSSIQLVGQW